LTATLATVAVSDSTSKPDQTSAHRSAVMERNSFFLATTETPLMVMAAAALARSKMALSALEDPLLIEATAQREFPNQSNSSQADNHTFGAKLLLT